MLFLNNKNVFLICVQHCIISAFSMKKTYLCFLFVIFLLSCHQAAKQIPEKPKGTVDSNYHTASTPSIRHRADTLAIPDDTVPKIFVAEGTIEVKYDGADNIGFEKYKVKLLDDGSTYNNSLSGLEPEYAKLEWKGIFHDKRNYYIKPTKVKFLKVAAEGDEDGKKTGWLPKCLDKDTCDQLIGGSEDLVTGPIKKLMGSQRIYYAGQKIEFNCNGVGYTLYTTGTKRNGKIYNCKLYLMANVKGHPFNQLLIPLGNDIELNGGGDYSGSIWLNFAGDIDGDGIPDLLISNVGDFNGGTFLYLSKPAGENKIVTLVAYIFDTD